MRVWLDQFKTVDVVVVVVVIVAIVVVVASKIDADRSILRRRRPLTWPSRYLAADN